MKRPIVFLAFMMALLGGTCWAQAPKVDMKDIMNYQKNKVDASAIPNSYSFSWKYSMEITTSKGKNLNFDYLLQPDASYYGSNMVQGKNSMFMIFDTKNKISISTFGKGDKKMAMASKIPDYSAMTNPKSTKMTYKPIPGKTILGYECKGMQGTNGEATITFYYTTKAPVSFSNIFHSQKSSGIPDVFKDLFKPNEKPLLLEMNYKNSTNEAMSSTMKCVGLQKENFTFNKSDYQFM